MTSIHGCERQFCHIGISGKQETMKWILNLENRKSGSGSWIWKTGNQEVDPESGKQEIRKSDWKFVGRNLKAALRPQPKRGLLWNPNLPTHKAAILAATEEDGCFMMFGASRHDRPGPLAGSKYGAWPYALPLNFVPEKTTSCALGVQWTLTPTQNHNENIKLKTQRENLVFYRIASLRFVIWDFVGIWVFGFEIWQSFALLELGLVLEFIGSWRLGFGILGINS